MKPPLGFIVLALVWSVPLTTYAIWHVRRAERHARRRIEAAGGTRTRVVRQFRVRPLQVRVVLPGWLQALVPIR